MERIALIGAGLIGRGWAIIFARAGHEVRLFDPAHGAAEACLRVAGERMAELVEAGLMDVAPEAALARIRVCASQEEALAGASWVQENGPERLEAKQAITVALDRTVPPDVVIASSTSGIMCSAYAGDVAGRARCVVAHPANPPYLMPLVEIVPAPFTAPWVVERTRTLMEAVGQVPIVARKEMAGFVLNRLQGALLGEAWRLVSQGVVSTEDLDRTVKDALGLRWSFMGPFETIDLNAPGGVRDYATRYGPLFHQVQREAEPRPWSEPLIAQVEAERRTQLPAEQLAERQAWRDRRLMALLAHKKRASAKE
ncbi:MAG: 3-hydroxyacyl-CoA dehydrogenase [Alphaproteobacteria bacterium]|nr:3-hydroxyacyl-CoA dehydrogenase [Alphaproteobacteria bacterium]